MKCTNGFVHGIQLANNIRDNASKIYEDSQCIPLMWIYRNVSDHTLRLNDVTIENNRIYNGIKQ